ncbi:MAG: hypothetical protein KBC69_00725 [Candidatus Magasanikbacteria bacterium]|nr:hypothetical protein [Candidatus Magasanikbacteria bacterium]
MKRFSSPDRAAAQKDAQNRTEKSNQNFDPSAASIENELEREQFIIHRLKALVKKVTEMFPDYLQLRAERVQHFELAVEDDERELQAKARKVLQDVLKIERDYGLERSETFRLLGKAYKKLFINEEQRWKFTEDEEVGSEIYLELASLQGIADDEPVGAL